MCWPEAIMPDDMPDTGVINAVIHARHGDPFAVLGPHPVPSGTAIRAFIPNADSVAVVARATGLELGTLSRVDAAGFWTGVIASDEPYLFRIASPSGERETEDAYSFPPMLGDIDIYLLGEGRHRDFARVLGAHVALIDDVSGVRFAVWAPNARRVSVVGSFNGWDGRCHPMRLRHGSGVWEIFVPRVAAGAIYKYELLGPDGAMLPLKADPVAQATERPPATGSVVADPAEAVWTDAEWLASCRAAAHNGTSVWRILGLSAAFTICSNRTPRPARGLCAFCRPVPPRRCGRHSRLGAGSFSNRRARPSALRRHAAVRAWGPTRGFS